ncbi:MAG: hypothetical protein DYH02_04635 [Candidatus Omnitrophica bacterium COP1]|nr:hypothetical protein [Candidatus Omnitrophica bacterium COP1]
MAGRDGKAQSKNHNKTHNYPFHAFSNLLIKSHARAGLSRKLSAETEMDLSKNKRGRIFQSSLRKDRTVIVWL